MLELLLLGAACTAGAGICAHQSLKHGIAAQRPRSLREILNDTLDERVPADQRDLLERIR